MKSTHTTGDSLQINKILSEMIDAGCEYCFMEVSSHAIHQNRVSNLKFDGGILRTLHMNIWIITRILNSIYQQRRNFLMN